MDIRQITSDFFAAPQISADQLSQIAKSGIKLVICNRPDEEVSPEFRADIIAAAAQDAGVAFAVLPLTHQTMTPDVIAENYALIKQSDGPVLAYCASGTRSTIAWAIGASKDLDADDIIEAARNGGYDIRNLRPMLTAARDA